MTTAWKKLNRKDLTTFDTFATDAVLTAMKLGGIGQIASNGHAKIRGRNGTSMIIARDTSAPHCQGNVMKALRKTFPELRTNASRKDAPMTSSSTTTDARTEDMLECPARGCDLRFATAEMVDAHVAAEHVVCGWEGCDFGPDGGPYVGRTNQAIAGHTNIKHKENKPWLANKEQAAANRAATITKRRQRAAEQAAKAAALTEEPAAVNGRVTNIEDWADRAGATRVEKETTPPVAVRVEDPDAVAKLALIREILGDDVEVAALKKEIADLKAHLALVREAVGLDFGDDDNE